MKKLLPVILLAFAIITGISFLFFVLRMIWFPPESMGMMMGRQMMYHHMRFWFGQVFWVGFIALGAGILLWLIYSKNKRK